MMVDKEYYERKKMELRERSEANKNWVIQEITNILNRFWKIQEELMRDYREVESREREEMINKEDKKVNKSKS